MKKILALLMAVMMCFLLCACSSSGDKDTDKKDDDSAVVDADSNSDESDEEEKEEENKPIDFTVDGGSIKYVGVEKANDGLCDEEDVVVIKFAFTSNMDVPSQCQRVFGIKFYQNGVQLDKSLSYSSKGGDQYDLVGDYFSEVMKGGTVTFGRLVQVSDYSPITIMVNEWGKNDNYQMMELDLGVLNGEAASDDAPAGEDEPATEPAETPTEPAEKEDAVKTIAIGDKIETDKFDFTLNKVELTYELKPKNTSSVYTSYTAEDAKVYVHIDGTYYNKAKKDACIRDLFIPTADYDDGYTYDGFVVIDDGDNSFDWVSSYVAATPLENCHYHGLIECPEVVDESDAPLFVTFKIDGTTYRYDIR